jgi:hypothetical protein
MIKRCGAAAHRSVGVLLLRLADAAGRRNAPLISQGENVPRQAIIPWFCLRLRAPAVARMSKSQTPLPNLCSVDEN